MRKYSVAIVGCGSIGALKDSQYDRPGGEAVLTHAHAFWQHPGTELIGFVDADMEKARDARHKWAKDTAYVYEDLTRERLYNTQPDIFVVATPTAAHRDTLMQVLALRPKLVVAEKPFCQNLKEAQEIHDAYAVAGIPVVVNYTRRFDPIAADTFDRLRSGKYGRIYAARCLYGRGLRRDGCHGLDVFNHVLGNPVGMFIDHDAIRDGCEPGDASWRVTLEYQKDGHKVTAEMVPADSRAWGAFELEFVTEKGVLAFPNWGQAVSWRPAAIEETFGQYKALSWPPQLEKTGLSKALLYMVDNCVRYLRDGDPLKCTAADALRVHEVLEQIK